MFLIKLMTKLIIAFTAPLFLIACATSSNIEMDQNFNRKINKKITIAITKPPKPILISEGSGLIGSAINEGMMSNIKIAVRNLNNAMYQKLVQQVAAGLKTNQTHVVIYPDFISNDYLASITGHCNATNEAFLFIKLNDVGISRHYGEIIPNGPPNAYISLTGELISCSSKAILWRYNITVAQPIRDVWDQPPYYQNLHDAFNKAFSVAKNELISNLKGEK